jgi:long-chain fatty acid transport protein
MRQFATLAAEMWMRIPLLITFCCLAAPQALFAQGVASPLPYTFNFINPGARSLALGGAFTGVSDDATAVFANPAGLLQLSIPEASLEIRATRLESEYLAGGRLSGTPTGRGIDVVPGVKYGTAISTDTQPGFLSFVYPASRVVVAFARHELLRLDQVAETQGVIEGDRIGDFRAEADRATRDIAITSYGVTIAVKVTAALSVGVGISLDRLAGESRELRFVLPGHFADPPNLDPADFTAAPSFDIVTRPTDHNAIDGRLGVLWRLAEAVQVGLSYRRGARFTLENLETIGGFSWSSRFKVPDVLTAGVALKPTRALTVSSDISQVRYGDLAELADEFEIFDAVFPTTVEFHLGIEYVFGGRFVPALRVGGWREPYSGAVSSSTFPFAALNYPSRPATGHVTFGGGLSLSRHFEVNVGADLSSRSRVASMSAIVRLPR